MLELALVSYFYRKRLPVWVKASLWTFPLNMSNLCELFGASSNYFIIENKNVSLWSMISPENYYEVLLFYDETDLFGSYIWVGVLSTVLDI